MCVSIFQGERSFKSVGQGIWQTHLWGALKSEVFQWDWELSSSRDFVQVTHFPAVSMFELCVSTLRRKPCCLVEKSPINWLNYTLNHGNFPLFDDLLSWQSDYEKMNQLFSPHIILRLQIPPFVKARTVLEGIEQKDEDKKEIKKKIAVLEVNNRTILSVY